MSWFLLSLLAAVSLATADALTKKYFSNLTPYEMGLIRLGYAMPWLVVSLFFITRPTVDRTYFLCLAVGLPLECIAFYCYMKAIKVSPLSLSLPFLAFTPIFVVLTGWILLDETISALGGVGIVLIVIGSYCLNWDTFVKASWRLSWQLSRNRGLVLCSSCRSFTPLPQPSESWASSIQIHIFSA